LNFLSRASGVGKLDGGSGRVTVSRSRIESCKTVFVQRGTLRLKRLRRSAVIEVIPWNDSSEPEIVVPSAPNEPRDPLKWFATTSRCSTPASSRTGRRLPVRPVSQNEKTPKPAEEKARRGDGQDDERADED
jgi:hypothetical protein